MNRQMTIEEIKRVSLDVLSELHDFCTRHDIKYSLGYGTAIGAVRHGGFIPWDDDVDICMPRADYDRLLATYKGNGDYELFAPERGNSYITYARLCEMRHTEMRSFTPCFTKPSGVWIDIFPFDAANDDYDTYYARQMRLLALKCRIDAKRDAMRPLRPSLGLKGIAHVLIKRLTTRYRLDDILKQYRKLCLEEAADSGKITNYHTLYRAKDWYPRHVFNEVVEVEFEGKKFCLMSGYDEYLRQTYGDYMQLPPEEKRKPIHGRHQYLWKDNQPHKKPQ